METRLCVVGKQNGENKELMQAIEVNTAIGSEFCFVGTVEVRVCFCHSNKRSLTVRLSI